MVFPSSNRLFILTNWGLSSLSLALLQDGWHVAPHLSNSLLACPSRLSPLSTWVVWWLTVEYRKSWVNQLNQLSDSIQDKNTILPYFFMVNQVSQLKNEILCLLLVLSHSSISLTLMQASSSIKQLSNKNLFSRALNSRVQLIVSSIQWCIFQNV